MARNHTQNDLRSAKYRTQEHITDNIIGDANNPEIPESDKQRSKSELRYCLEKQRMRYIQFPNVLDGREIGISITHQRRARAIRTDQIPLKSLEMPKMV